MTAILRKSVLRSVRLDDDVWGAVKGMECSLNQYLRTVLLDGTGPAPGLVASPAFQQGVERGKELRAMRETPAPETGPVVSAVAQFKVTCQHCGKKFSAESSKAVLCEACANDGHKGDRYGCEQCRYA